MFQAVTQICRASVAALKVRPHVVVLFFLAVGCYSPLIQWGQPPGTGPDRTKTFAIDEILPLEALAEMHNTFVVSKPDRNYGYPWFHYFVVAAAQAPYIGYLKLSGGMSKSSPEYPFGLRDPVSALRHLTLIGRAVSVLMAAGIVLAAYFFSSTLWNHKTGIAAALLTMVNYLMVYYGRVGNLDVPMFFWTSLALVVYARILKGGFTARRAAWLGLFVGLAGATKDQAGVLFLPLGLALLVSSLARPESPDRPVRPPLVALTVCLAAYLAATGMLVDPQRHLTHLYRNLFEVERVSSIPFYYGTQPLTLARAGNMLQDFLTSMGAMFSWPVLLVSVAGAVILRRSSPRYLIFWISILLHFLILVLPVGFCVRRYLLPYTLFVDGFAAFALIQLGDRGMRIASKSLFAVLLCWRLVLGFDLSYAQANDTRYAASAWIQGHAHPDDRIEFFGMSQKLPPLPAEFQVRRIEGRTQWKRESGHGPQVLRYLQEQGPEYILIIPDATSKPDMEHSGDCPPEVFEALNKGTVPYRLVAYFPPPSILPKTFSRPRLDNPSVAPPVRIFARKESRE